MFRPLLLENTKSPPKLTLQYIENFNFIVLHVVNSNEINLRLQIVI